MYSNSYVVLLFSLIDSEHPVLLKLSGFECKVITVVGFYSVQIYVDVLQVVNA